MGWIWKEIMFSHKEALLSGDEYSVLPDYSWETLSLSKLIVETFLLNASVLQVKSITFSLSSSINDIALGFSHCIKSLKPSFWCQLNSNHFSTLTQFWISFPAAFTEISDTGSFPRSLVLILVSFSFAVWCLPRWLGLVINLGILHSICK